MAVIRDPDTTTKAMAVEGGLKASRIVKVTRGVHYGVANLTGTIAAALAINSSVFAMRLDPSSVNRAFIEQIKLQFMTVVAFTTPVSAVRRLGLFRGSGAAASGGTAIAAANKKHSTSGASQFDSAQGGDMRIATTGALTVTGITFETDPFELIFLGGVGTAGATFEYDFGGGEISPIQLEPGELLAIRNPVAMDAAGTWVLTVAVHWFEAPAIDSTE